MPPRRKFWQLSAAEYGSLLTATLLISSVRGALSVLPFRRVLRLVNRVPARPHRSARQDELDRAVWAIEIIGRRMLRRPCLTQALATQIIFRRSGRPTSLRIGVAKPDRAQLHAHAWIECDGEIIIGGATSPETYVSLPPIVEH